MIKKFRVSDAAAAHRPQVQAQAAPAAAANTAGAAPIGRGKFDEFNWFFIVQIYESLIFILIFSNNCKRH